MNISDLPFNQFLGLRTSESGGAVVLTPEQQHLNHVETLHATVLYGLAEAASGQALLNRFPLIAETYVAVLRSSTVKYRNPGFGSVDCVAVGMIGDDKANGFQSQLDARGRAILDVDVQVDQNDARLLTGTFTWFVAQIERRQPQ